MADTSSVIVQRWTVTIGRSILGQTVIWVSERERVSLAPPPLSCYRHRPCSRCWLCSSRHVTLAHVSSSLPPRHPSPDNVYKSNIVTRQRAAHTMPFCWAKSLNHSSQSIRICFRDTRAPACLQILTCCVYTYVNSSSVLPAGWKQHSTFDYSY